MAVPRSRPRRLLCGVVAVLLLGALPAVAAPSRAGAADVAPPFRLTLPDRVVAYGSDGRIWGDLRLSVDAGDQPFELALQRLSYDQGITVTQTKPTTRVLGTGLTRRLDRLSRFVTLRFTPVGANPHKPFRLVRPACLSGTSARIDPDAPATSPYPWTCMAGFGIYALGNTQGVQAGHGGSVLRPWGSLPVPRGRWDVVARVTDKWADALGLTRAQRQATTRLIVKGYEDGVRRPVRPRSESEEPVPATTEPTADSLLTGAELPPGTPLPDLRSLPPFGMQISGNGNFLQFSATVWNGGDSPLVVDGFRRSGEDVMDAYQYFFDSDGNQVDQYVDVGEFEWDPKPTHQHWHFRSFASYTLVPVDHQHPGEDPDGHHVRSRKEAFCLANTDAVDFTGPGADWSVYEDDLGTACGDYDSRAIREVLSAGWGDTYSQFRAGQSFDLRGLPNGCYRVVVEGNPVIPRLGRRLLVESDYDNNTWRRKVCIGGTDGARTIRRVAPVGIVEEPTYVMR